MGKVSPTFGFAYVYGILALALVLTSFILGRYAGEPTRVVHSQVVVSPASAAQLVKSWGKPDQILDGSRINANLKGLTCALYQAKKTIICYVP